MQSSDVQIETPALHTQYNALRADVIANASLIGEVMAAHVAAAASLHGLGAGVSVLGAAQAAGLRVEYGVAAATWTHVGGQHEVHHAGMAWANPFSNIFAVVNGVTVNSNSGAAYAEEIRNMTFNATGATLTVYVYNTQGENTSLQACFLAIGV
jgi:hypothetical protein